MTKIPTSSKMKKLKEVLKYTAINSTAQCLPRIFKAHNKFISFIWTLIFSLFAGLTSYLILRDLLGYFEYQVVSTIRIVNEVPAPFPAIQICNGGFLTKEMQPIVDRILKENYNDATNDTSVYFERVENVTQLVKMELKNMKNLSNFTTAPLIVKCQFDKTPCDLNNDIEYRYNYKHGECLRFNGGENEAYLKKSRVENEDNGLKLWIGPILGPSLKIFVNNKSFSPLSPDGLYVRGGEEIFLKVLRQYSYNTPYPYSSCIDMSTFDSMYFRKTIESYKKYGQAYCFRLCIQKLIIDNCKCYHPKYTRLDNFTGSCQNLTDLECIDKYENSFVGEKINECQRECPLECEKVTYELQLSSFDLSLDQFEAFFNKNKSLLFNVHKRNFLILNIFYPHLEYTVITVEPKTNIIDLISSLGGALGIFLGLSIFNFVEMIECVFLGFKIIFQ